MEDFYERKKSKVRKLVWETEDNWKVMSWEKVSDEKSTSEGRKWNSRR